MLYGLWGSLMIMNCKPFIIIPPWPSGLKVMREPLIHSTPLPPFPSFTPPPSKYLQHLSRTILETLNNLPWGRRKVRGAPVRPILTLVSEQGDALKVVVQVMEEGGTCTSTLGLQGPLLLANAHILVGHGVTKWHLILHYVKSGISTCALSGISCGFFPNVALFRKWYFKCLSRKSSISTCALNGIFCAFFPNVAFLRKWYFKCLLGKSGILTGMTSCISCILFPYVAFCGSGIFLASSEMLHFKVGRKW